MRWIDLIAAIAWIVFWFTFAVLAVGWTCIGVEAAVAKVRRLLMNARLNDGRKG